MARITIRDVAQRAGVSISAVSYILNKSDKKKYSPETIARVEAAASELGYVPNSIARSMRSQRAHAIGVVNLWSMGERVFVKLLEGIVARAAQANYAVTICPYESYMDYFRNSRMDGIVFIAPFSGSRVIDEEADVRGMLAENLPCVIINGSTRVEGASYIYFDFYNATQRLTEYLLEKGYRHITYVTSDPAGRTEYLDRQRGYEETMRAAGHQTDVCLTDEVPSRIGSFEAVVACKSSTGRIVLEEAIAQGRHIPQDFPVVAGNTENYSEFLYPPLTTTQFPFEQIGAQAVESLLRQINGEAEPTVEWAKNEILHHQSG